MSANVTAWNSFTRSFDAGKFPEADLICMQEHKQSGKAAELPAAQAWCKKTGFAHSFKEAIVTAKEGRSSGVAIMWNKHRKVRSAANLEGVGPRLNAVYATVPGIGEVLIITVYGDNTKRTWWTHLRWRVELRKHTQTT